MKILYYSTCSCSQPHIGVLINSLLEDLKDGHEVFWVYCDCAVTSCIMNPNGSDGYCWICHYSYKQLVNKFGKGVHVIPFSPMHTNKRLLDYKTSLDLKKIEYKDVKIGYSILSFYISRTRNMDFEVDLAQKKYFDNIINEVCDSIDEIEPILDEIVPNRICTYNGRYFENRFIYDLAIKKRIEFISLEVIGGHNEPYYAVRFPGNLPHSIILNTKLIDKTWEESKETLDDKNEKSSLFYKMRRQGVAAGDKVYTRAQRDGLLPEGFDPSKRNFAIFNSSADELAGIGGEWEEATKLFPSQYESIKYILSVATSDMHFYLRIHPNLKDVSYNYHTDLYKLKNKFDNITVIEPHSPISSYTLMNVCEKIIVFGSTIGVESCFWEKPVILIGTAFYAGLDVCYKAETVDDIKRLLVDKLHLKSKNGALRYAYFLMDRKVRIEPFKNIEYNFEYQTFLGQKLKVSKYHSIFGSHVLHAIVNKFFTAIISRITPNKFKYPNGK